MGIPIEVPGLDTLIPELDTGRILVVESGPDPAKSFFIRRLALTANAKKFPVTILTSRDREEMQGLLTRESNSSEWDEGDFNVLEREGLKNWEGLTSRNGLLAVDSFSFLTLDSPVHEMSTLMRDLRTKVRIDDLTVVLGTDRGMFDPRSEAVAHHLADGVIQFHSKEAPEGVTRFLRIPKWMNGRFVDRNVYYDFDGKRLAIDLRRRVL